MGSVKVTVYGRIKPRQKSVLSQDYKLKYGDHEDQITFPATNTSGKKVFRFKKIFGEDATQKQVFEAVAKPVIKNVFEGYNGTIFTYGQTGSGKTHTMTGSLEDWVDTGLIPRTVQEVFQMKDSDTVISITYFEIYNEHVYDLIRADRVDSDMSQDSCVDETSTITSFRNLSVHIVKSACEALLLYRRGDANKMVAETSSNARSSRSHVIFSIGFEFPHPKEEMISLKPVLYLVDLAGSERITKCKTPMANPWETRYINLSLHYLEQVLVALRQPGRAHIPYRNSLMTALLRNSLGGNCITAMVATFSLSIYDIEETMQTCRFAERIALIKNEVKLSELTTPQKEIETLKKENERLKTQLKLMCNEQVHEQLTDKDKETCNEMVQNFLRDNDFFALPLTDIRRMEFCFCLMRNEILKKKNPLPVKTDSKTTSDTFSLIKSNLWSLQAEVPEDKNDDDILNNISNNNSKINIPEKNPRRKRNPLELPKVNITYKRWKSTELLSGKETPMKKSNVKGAQSRAQTSVEKPGKHEPKNQFLLPSTTSQFEDLRNVAEFMQEKDFGMKARPRTPNFGLKFSGESNTENINSISVSSENSEKPGVISDDNREQKHKSVCHSEEPNKCLSTGVLIDDKIASVKSLEWLESKDEDLHGKDQFSAICVPLTGDQEVDEEILRFYESRYQIFKGACNVLAPPNTKDSLIEAQAGFAVEEEVFRAQNVLFLSPCSLTQSTFHQLLPSSLKAVSFAPKRIYENESRVQIFLTLLRRKPSGIILHQSKSADEIINGLSCLDELFYSLQKEKADFAGKCSLGWPKQLASDLSNHLLQMYLHQNLTNFLHAFENLEFFENTAMSKMNLLTKRFYQT